MKKGTLKWDYQNENKTEWKRRSNKQNKINKLRIFLRNKEDAS